MTNPLRTIAMYLPQYHPIPENDAWWGEGFTEWTNVRKAKPRFPGHYQPHVPGQLGYYDLRDPAARRAQAEMAREYGVYGFCYYHYWFNGKRLLETPFNEVLNSGEPDFPFCLCWANENWSRRWDGSDKELLMEQHYCDEDNFNFINELIPVFRDERYIRVNGRPLLLVYRTGLLPDPKRTAEIWREATSKAGVGDLYLVRVENFMEGVEPTPESIGFDAAMEFAPYWDMIGPPIHQVAEVEGAPQTIPEDTYVYDYGECMLRMVTRQIPDYKLFRGIFPCWDNSSRRKSEPTVFIDSTPAKFAFWLAAVSQYTLSRFHGDERLVFVNAWNEWGEGCHLEPDEKYGLAHLEAMRLVLTYLRVNKEKIVTLDNSADNREVAYEGWLELLRGGYGHCSDGHAAESGTLHASAFSYEYLHILMSLHHCWTKVEGLISCIREIEEHNKANLAEIEKNCKHIKQLQVANEELREANEKLHAEFKGAMILYEKHISILDQENSKVQALFQSITSSFSWRATKPIRSFLMWCSNIKNRF